MKKLVLFVGLMIALMCVGAILAADQLITESGDVLNLNGDVEIKADQTVDGDVVAISGNALIRGKVNANVVTLDGDIDLNEGCYVKGDVLAIGGTVTRHANDLVGGSKLQISAPWVEEFLKDISSESGTKPAVTERYEQHLKHAPSVLAAGDKGVVHFGQDVHVGPGETVNDDIVVFGGEVEVLGKVKGDIVSFGGPVDISGAVSGDVVTFGGSVHLRGNAKVSGDVVTMGGTLREDDGAVISGQRVALAGPGVSLGAPVFNDIFKRAFVSFDPLRRIGLSRHFRPLARIGHWLLNNLALLMLLLILVFAMPRQVDTIALRVADKPGRALLYGIVGMLLFLPLLIALIALVVTWIVIPFYVAAVVGLGLVGTVGMDILIGRWVSRQFKWTVGSILTLAIIGFVALCLVGLMKSVPVVGLAASIFLLAVGIFGFGGALMTCFGTDPTGTWLAGKRTMESTSLAPQLAEEQTPEGQVPEEEVPKPEAD